MESETSHLRSKEEILTSNKKRNKDKKYYNNNNRDNYSESIPRNYSESGFFEKIFYFWVKSAIELANKRPLENKDVCKISQNQCTNKNLRTYQEIFLKKSSNKNSKYPLF